MGGTLLHDILNRRKELELRFEDAAWALGCLTKTHPEPFGNDCKIENVRKDNRQSVQIVLKFYEEAKAALHEFDSSRWIPSQGNQP